MEVLFVKELNFSVRSCSGNMWWSGYVLLRAAPQGRFLSVRKYPRHSKKVNTSSRKHDLEERVALFKGNIRKRYVSLVICKMYCSGRR